MSLFEGTAPPLVDTSRTTTTTAPDYLTNYLTDLARSGQTALSQPADQLIAELPENLRNLYQNAPETLARYQTPLEDAATTARTAGQGITAADISSFYNPYEEDVVNEMARQSALNVQQGMLPMLRGAFAGQGAFGSRRYAGALGQAMSDVQGDLLGAQSKLRSEGYKSALDAALRQKVGQTQAATALGNIGKTEADAATSSLKAMGDIGLQELAYDQSRIEAPLTRAQNVAQIMRGYTYPTTVSETARQPASSYGPSILGQIAGLGSLLGSGFNAPSGWGNRLTNWLGGLMSPAPSGTSFAGVNAEGTPVYYNSGTGAYTDISGNVVPITGSEGE